MHWPFGNTGKSAHIKHTRGHTPSETVSLNIVSAADPGWYNTCEQVSSGVDTFSEPSQTDGTDHCTVVVCNPFGKVCVRDCERDREGARWKKLKPRWPCPSETGNRGDTRCMVMRAKWIIMILVL